jgi:hypothetical protein
LNIILIEAKFNISETKLCTFSKDDLKIKEAEGFVFIEKRVYQLEMDNSKCQVECPVIMNADKLAEIMMPAFKSPYRRYPTYVYIYAVVRHLSGLGMRKTAKEVGKKFGILKFSHSTISRILKLLIEKELKICEVKFLTEEDITQEDVVKKVFTKEAIPVEIITEETIKNKAELIIHEIKPNVEEKHHPKHGDYDEADLVSQQNTSKTTHSNSISDTNSNSSSVSNLYKILSPILKNPELGLKLVYQYFILFRVLLL